METLMLEKTDSCQRQGNCLETWLPFTNPTERQGSLAEKLVTLKKKQKRKKNSSKYSTARKQFLDNYSFKIHKFNPICRGAMLRIILEMEASTCILCTIRTTNAGSSLVL
jgi:hypothetical protein